MKDVDFEKRNFIINSVEGAFFISTGAFVSAQTVLPALVTRLGGTNVEIGALGVISYAALFLPQLFASRYVETLPWKKGITISLGIAHRSVLLMLGIIVLLLGETRPTLTLWLLLGLVFCQQALVGLSTPGWFDLIAKLTSKEKRGRLIGLRTSLGGISAFLGSLILTWLLLRFHFPLNYALAIIIAFVLQMLSLAIQTRLVESTPSATVQRRPVFEYLRAIPDIIRQNKPFRRFLVSTSLLILAAMPVGFFTVYGLRHFAAAESVVGEFTLTIVAVQVVSALANGYLADRFGNKIVLILAAGSLLCSSLTALMAPTLAWYRIVFVFLGVTLGSEVMARYNMVIEFGPVEQRSTYIGIMNSLVAPFYFSGLLGGWLIDRFGFHFLFTLASIFSILGIAVLALTVREPRGIRGKSLNPA